MVSVLALVGLAALVGLCLKFRKGTAFAVLLPVLVVVGVPAFATFATTAVLALLARLGWRLLRKQEISETRGMPGENFLLRLCRAGWGGGIVGKVGDIAGKVGDVVVDVEIDVENRKGAGK